MQTDRLSSLLYFIVLVLISITSKAQARINKCRNTKNYQIQHAALGGNVTFNFCVTSPSRPHNSAIFPEVGQCSQGAECGGKYIWTLHRFGSRNAYKLDIQVLFLQHSDFGNLTVQIFDAAREDVIAFKLSLEQVQDLRTTLIPAVRTKTTSFPAKNKPITKNTVNLYASVFTAPISDTHTSTSATTLLPSTLTTTATAAHTPSSSSSPLALTISASSPPLTTASVPSTIAETAGTTTTAYVTTTRTTTTTTKIQTTTPTTIPTSSTTATATTSPLPPTTTTFTTTTIATATTSTSPVYTEVVERCLSPNDTPICPKGWYQDHDSNCAVLDLVPASYLEAQKNCEKLNARLMTSAPQSYTEDIAQCVYGIYRRPLLWLDKPEDWGSRTCQAFNLVSNRSEILSCNERYPYICLMDSSFYAKPRIQFMNVNLYTSDTATDSNATSIFYKRYNVSVKEPDSILLDPSVTSISVECQAEGDPQPRVIVRSSLIGGTDNDVTVMAGSSSIRYRRPDSLIGALGTVSCSATNIYADEISTADLTLAATYEARIVSFRGSSRQLQHGDTMVLRCAAVGFPAPNIRIVHNASGSPVNATETKANTVEYTISNITCDSSGWFRCEVADAVTGKITRKDTHTEILQCPPTCPTNLTLLNQRQINKLRLSWKPGFNGGDEQSFILFIQSNDTKWRRYDRTLHSEDTHVLYLDVSQLSAQTNYSFRIIPTNRFVRGALNASACTETMTFSTWKQPSMSNTPQLSYTFNSGGFDASNVVIIVVSFLAVCCIICAIFSSQITTAIKKHNNRHLSIALEKLVRFSFVSDPDTNGMSADSKSSSQSSVFESNTDIGTHVT
ncbi:hypothetical protein PoB_006622500 [Plakobranchus ocellatus]|uniref:Uncharacterized protein n=1 Tax=Plakobranchus ocellatus TaxID=259542 RepID=A0AAV4D6V2_9GAST|nr:hypothetical protein PoB_006622500 [Plakobranchus ocellatus]